MAEAGLGGQLEICSGHTGDQWWQLLMGSQVYFAGRGFAKYLIMGVRESAGEDDFKGCEHLVKWSCRFEKRRATERTRGQECQPLNFTYFLCSIQEELET